MARAKVYIANRQKKTKIPTGARLLIKRCCNAVLAYEKVEFPAEISVSFTDDEGIRQLNGSYRNKDSATDVLSFPMGEDGVYDKNEETGNYLLGDIVISMERAVGAGPSLRAFARTGAGIPDRTFDVSSSWL